MAGAEAFDGAPPFVEALAVETDGVVVQGYRDGGAGFTVVRNDAVTNASGIATGTVATTNLGTVGVSGSINALAYTAAVTFVPGAANKLEFTGQPDATVKQNFTFDNTVGRPTVSA